MTHRSRTADEDESPEAKKRKREEFERARAEANRERDDARRHMFTCFRMWKICPDKRCMRAKACNGDVEECLNDRWHVVVPAEFKAELYKALEFMKNGMSALEAVRAARKEMAERKRIMAEFDARHASKPAAPAPAPASIRRRAPVSRGPRVRGLV